MTDDFKRVREMLLREKYEEIVAQGTAVVPSLIEAVNYTCGKVQESAARALGIIAENYPEYDSIVAVPALVYALKYGDMGVVDTVIGALAKIGPATVRAVVLEVLEQVNRLPVGSGLANVLVIPDLRDKNKDMQVAVEILVRIGEPAVPALIDALKHADGMVRQSAAKGLARIAETAEIDLRAVEKALREQVDYVKDGTPSEVRKSKKEALAHYMRIAEVAKRRTADRHSLAGDGVILVGERPKSPSGKGMYRAGREARAVA